MEAKGSDVAGCPGLCQAVSNTLKANPKERHSIPQATCLINVWAGNRVPDSGITTCPQCLSQGSFQRMRHFIPFSLHQQAPLSTECTTVASSAIQPGASQLICVSGTNSSQRESALNEGPWLLLVVKRCPEVMSLSPSQVDNLGKVWYPSSRLEGSGSQPP